jgi:hypothetical protein
MATTLQSLVGDFRATRLGQTDVDKRQSFISKPHDREGGMNEYPETILFPVDLCTRSRNTSRLGVVIDGC